MREPIVTSVEPTIAEGPGDGPAAEAPLLVFADDWGRHPSSCQHLIRRLRDDFRVLWVNSIGTRRVRADSLTFRRGLEKLRNWRRGLSQVDDRMWVVDLPMIPNLENRSYGPQPPSRRRSLAADPRGLGMEDPCS